MRFVSLLIFLICSSAVAFGQDIAALIREAEKLEAIPKESAAFLKYREVLKVQPANVYVLTRCSELCSKIGKRQNNDQLRDEYYAAAKIYAEGALKLAPNNAEANCVMAIALGRTALTKSGKEKVANAKEIKRHLDIALKYDPQNYKAWHILGKWHFEISNLSFLERTAIRILYGGVPDASMKDAIAAFEKARSLFPGFILNYLELAKAYKTNGDKGKAIAQLKEMFLQKNISEDDALIKEQGKALLKELSGQ